MCGIAGFIDFSRQTSAERMKEILIQMTDAIRHRGPDDGNSWVDASAGVGLGFRRLAIIDLTPTGRQPMTSFDRRYVIVFNGEIYNFRSLRQELESTGCTFRGTSDTEVILAAVCRWGVENTIPRLNGMFVFALWDKLERCLWLCRDRIGIKPLYYGWQGNTFLFGSELKALRSHPAFQAEIDRNALACLLRHNYIPAPYSIYQGIAKMMPGTWLKIRLLAPQTAETVIYWSARETAEKGIAEPFTGSDQEAVEALDSLLRESVRLRMVADVPLGAFLSGGVDSSTVVALMQQQSTQPVRTFTIGFHESDYDEAPYARRVAQHLGTEHTELYVTPAEAQAVIPRLPSLYDEPFSDSSQIPTFLVSQLARQQVTVSLSGDGGDELFAGYNRYTHGQNIWKSVSWMPYRSRQFISRFLCSIRPGIWNGLLKAGGGLIPPEARHPQFADKIHRIGEIIAMNSAEDIYLDLVSHWKKPSDLVQGSSEYPTALTDPSRWANLPDLTRRMMYLDLISYLPDDILVKVDRASMGVSLEARVPLLDDHRVVEFAWRLPLQMKIRNGKSKWLLRKVLYQYVPPQLIERPKKGFAIPLDSWLRGSLREWAESLLNETRLRNEGYFNPQPIRQKWLEHQSGRHNWQFYLWDILMFQAWLDELSIKRR